MGKASRRIVRRMRQRVDAQDKAQADAVLRGLGDDQVSSVYYDPYFTEPAKTDPFHVRRDHVSRPQTQESRRALQRHYHRQR